jgi:hypothetical protein
MTKALGVATSTAECSCLSFSRQKESFAAEDTVKIRPLLTAGLILAGLLFLSWRTVTTTFGLVVTETTYTSPAGQFTLPTEDATAGTLGQDYQLATFRFGVPKSGPPIGDLVGNTGNGFSDRYDFANLNAFSIAQAANNIGDLDSQDPNNAVPGPGGTFIKGRCGWRQHLRATGDHLPLDRPPL